MLGSSCVAAQFSASQEGLSSMSDEVMNMYGEMEVKLHEFVASVLVNVRGQIHIPATLPPSIH
jgi:hypothetical protein